MESSWTSQRVMISGRELSWERIEGMRKPTMKIHARIFDLGCPPPASRQLIAWIDQHGNGKHTQHVHPSKTLLDVEAGHVIIHRRKQ